MVRRAPGSVWLAASSLCVVIAVQTGLALLLARGGQVGWAQFAFAAMLGILLVVGLLRAHRLAWLWGRYLSFFLAVMLSVSMAVAFAKGQAAPWILAVVLGGMALPLLAAASALGRRSAAVFFDLVCPECGTATRYAFDLLFRRARCRKCRHVW
jgi:hypothetical protein